MDQLIRFLKVNLWLAASTLVALVLYVARVVVTVARCATAVLMAIVQRLCT